VRELGPESPDTHLFLDLTGRDPDDAANKLAYEKGYFFLRLIEETVGRKAFDGFLRDYFERHAFQSMTTDAFVVDLRTNLLAKHPGVEDRIGVAAWVHGPGIPKNVPRVQSNAFEKVEEQVRAFESGTAADRLRTAGWSTHEWIHFLRHLPRELTPAQMTQLDKAFAFSASGNSEILHEWLLQSIQHDYRPAYDALEKFLSSQGRRKFLKPLYEKLAETEAGRTRAKTIYAKARKTYHSVSRGTIDGILKWEP
jgi:leukotriene-A4 hydrolase